MKKIPSSVYHLQINEDFPLSKARQIIPYLENLGIEGILSSPLFETAGSNLYEIVDPNLINSKIGSNEEFEDFINEMQQKDLKLIFDVVPNHLGIRGQKNIWWQDVLEKGPNSEYSDFFDIDWHPPKRELKNKVLIPVLKDFYGKSILDQKIKLVWQESSFYIQTGDYILPLVLSSYPFILYIKKEKQISFSFKERDSWKEFVDTIVNRHKTNLEESKLKTKLLYNQSSFIRESIEQILLNFNGKKGNKESFDLLHELLEQQFYRLAFWQVGNYEINYRRFFNISELIAIHIEKDRVLNEHHRLTFDLIKQGKIQGLRIDHPDGLYHPEHYFEKLRENSTPLIIIEKILDTNESIPPNWYIDGTVGYEFLNVLNGIFIQKKNEIYFNKIYKKFIGYEIDFDQLLYERKKRFIETYMISDLQLLGWKLSQLSEKNRDSRDFTQTELTRALKEIMSCFPVYRTYIQPEKEISDKEREYINNAIEKAKQKNLEIFPEIYNFIRNIFLTTKDPNSDELDFILRFQQATAPVMAKGLEDSCFYIFNRFLSLNEVGSNLHLFGVSPSSFHQFNIEKKLTFPLGLLPLSTHDTKRSCDARMRLNVLSELPHKWRKTVFFWKKENQKFKKKINKIFFPDPNTEYYLYQMILSFWPNNDHLSSQKFERLWKSFLKAMREAGIYTSWKNPSEEFESAGKEFLTSILTPNENNTFYPSFIAFTQEISRFGQLNSLASLILSIGSCGIFDLYQGDEWWNFSLMDPDNRRPVDFDLLTNILKGGLSPNNHLKLWMVKKSLQFRKAHKDLLLKGEYIPLKIKTVRKDHIIAFMRKTENSVAIFVTARFFAKLPENILGKECWNKTSIILPSKLNIKELKDIFTNKTILLRKQKNELVLNIADLFQTFPFAILTDEATE